MPTTMIRETTHRPGLLVSVLIRWAVNMVGLWIAALLGTLTYHGKVGTLLPAAAVLAVLNTFVRPVLNFLAIPFIVVTFGFFMLVVSAFTLWLTSGLVSSFDLYGFWDTIWAAVVLAIANFALSGMLRDVASERSVERIEF